VWWHYPYATETCGGMEHIRSDSMMPQRPAYSSTPKLNFSFLPSFPPRCYRYFR